MDALDSSNQVLNDRRLTDGEGVSGTSMEGTNVDEVGFDGLELDIPGSERSDPFKDR